MEIPGKEVSKADRADIAKLEEKIAAGEARLKEINDLFTTKL